MFKIVLGLWVCVIAFVIGFLLLMITRACLALPWLLPAILGAAGVFYAVGRVVERLMTE